MGIKNLSKFLQKHVPHLYEKKSLAEYSGKRIAIDTHIFLYRFKSMAKSRWMNSLVNMILQLKRYNIQPIFIYDTKAHDLKWAKIQERKKRRSQANERIENIRRAYERYEKSNHREVDPILTQIVEKSVRQVSKLLKPMDMDRFLIDPVVIQQEISRLEKQTTYVSSQEVELSKQLLQLLGIVHIDSENEAEILCAQMCCHGHVDAVLSNDTDVLVYGTPVFLCNANISHKKDLFVVQEVRFEEILKSLALTYEEFRDFCIMCGTDYNNNIYRIGCEKAYKYIKKYSSIENIRDALGLDVSVLEHDEVRKIFCVPDKMGEMELDERSTNKDALQVFLIENQCNLDILEYF